MGKSSKNKKKAPPPSTSKGKASGKQQGGSKQPKKKQWSKGNWESGDHLSSELQVVGLRVKEVVGDGNCCFRAIGDQLEGDKADHKKIRKTVCQYIEDNREVFAPFVEDDESFESYLKRIRKDGTWAGQIELQAASLAFEVNICIYQYQQPRWTLENFPSNEAKTIHISYHDGEHYNSVRDLEDYSPGPPEDIKMKEGVPVKQTDWDDPTEEDLEKEQVVLRNTGCDDQNTVRMALKRTRGNVDEAVEMVIDLMAGIQPMDEDTETAHNNNADKENKQPQTDNPTIKPCASQNSFTNQSQQSVTQTKDESQCDNGYTNPQSQVSEDTKQQSQNDKESNADGVENDIEPEEMEVDKESDCDQNEQQSQQVLEQEQLSNDTQQQSQQDLTQESQKEDSLQQTQNQQQSEAENNGSNSDSVNNGVEGQDIQMQNEEEKNEENDEESTTKKETKKGGKKKKTKGAKKDLTAQKKHPRNQRCHCGSGKKYKNCHGPIDAARERRNEGRPTEKENSVQQEDALVKQTNAIYLQQISM
eukprot:TRINITY_DN1933_c1_g1_i1.p1 TRINITY_DN1933_c1_g1~~TRINITY_DN1933_c1_g1_i1.p1  ORF type:complete len:531 (+),score=101.46 TRINITY_DN1933_c1_g1_i1:61-1653(+)